MEKSSATKTKVFCARAAGTVGVFLLGCGSVPETFYYTPAYELPAPANNETAFDQVLGIEKLESEVIYHDDRLIYRDSPFEIRYYHYRRWLTEPHRLVTEKVLSHLRHRRIFRDVVAYPATVKLDYVLRGRLIAFEEWDTPEQWYGKVAIRFELVDAEREQVVWCATFEKMTPAEKRIPVAIVQAISASLKSCLEEMAAALRNHLAAGGG